MLISKILDLIILVLVSIFFIGMLGSEFPALGIVQPLIPIPHEWKHFFDILIYPIIVLLVIDLAMKYRKTNDLKEFVKKYWIDIAMLILIPVFSAFKFFKFGLSIVKKLKTVKMGVKIAHKTKKVSQK
ncbi:MAG: hypothetical protein OER82_12400 [Nitrosopumilus sp.]|nr:hypothetical protein [Nitrosopumilus sp.]